MTEQQFDKLVNLAESLIRYNDICQSRLGIEGWEVEVNTTRRRAIGLCNYRRQVIQLCYVPMMCIDYSEGYDTVLHEIAHAIAGPSANHGMLWRQTFMALGGSGNRVYKPQAGELDSIYRWARVCPLCDSKRYYVSKPTSKRARSCGACSGGRYNERCKLEIVKL